MPQPIKALVFDAYGTLFDGHSIVTLCDSLDPGGGTPLAHLWRAKQFESLDSVIRDEIGFVASNY